MAFAEWGFGVFSVWGVTDGVCRCPKAESCTSPGKHPIPNDGLKSATTDTTRVAHMLQAPGSQGQYGVVPAPHVVILDVDGEGWQEKLRDLMLPRTFAVETANGVHLYFYWPESYGPQPTRLHGWVVRSEEHPGYVIGPGSVHQSGKTYRIARMNGSDIHTKLGTIAQYPEEGASKDAPTITVGQGLRTPESIPEGGRHDYLRDRARTLRGGGLTGDALLTAMQSINARLPSPKSDEELRRAIGDVETKFGEDPAPVAPAVAVAQAVQTHDLIVPAQTYVANTDRHPRWASPFAVFGHVSLVSGPAKSGKSTFISGLVHAREAGGFYLWGQPIPVGPTLYISEESGASFADKVDGLTLTDVMDWASFVRSGLNKRSHVLELVANWCESKDDPMVVLDTLAVWALITDENDAMETNRAIGEFNTLADTHGACIVIGHHSRKGGGDHGEGIRGSSAIFGAVALSIEFRYYEQTTDTRRRLALSGRFGSPSSETIDFDPATGKYIYTHATPSYGELTKHIPMEAPGVDGLTRDDLRGIWGKDPRKDAKRLVDVGELIERVVKVGRVSKTVYYKAPPLLDVRPVSARMGDIIKGGKDES